MISDFAAVPLSTNERRTLLSPLEAARGVLAMHRNGRRLFRDAVLLYEQGRIPSAVLLAVLAHEEFGKAASLGLYAVIDHEGGLRKLWKGNYENHHSKNWLSVMVAIVSGHVNAEGGTVDEAASQFLRLRERATYVDCVHGAEPWSLPEMVFGPADVKTVLEQVFAGIRKSQRPSQAVGHLGEVWAEALERKGDHTSSEEREFHRAREAVVWANSEEARSLDTIDREEGSSWIRDVRSRLGIE